MEDWAESSKKEAEVEVQIAKIDYDPQRLFHSYHEVMLSLPKGSVLVDYVKYNKYLSKGRWELFYGAIILARNTEPQWMPLGSAKAIDELIVKYDPTKPALDEAYEKVLRGLHDKLIVLINSAGYWEPLKRLFEHVIAGGFADESARRLYQFVDSVDDVFDAVAEAPAPAIPARDELI